MVDGVIRLSCAGVGRIVMRRSADPDFEVEARLPCLAIRSSEEARMDEVVDMLNVLWESPPVPTISHWIYKYVLLCCFCCVVIKAICLFRITYASIPEESIWMRWA